ncbi:hypothetical protein SAMN05443667_10815 [Flavobacterium gillisiae]|uniref:Uncharacterized protein n=1 Tax=Flavobacterium gillisiae TaxID=150146 RepID=A0A1H4DMZ7_9FLAO|nr:MULTISPECIES: hypothetical protein [Flavobacterium]SEA74141.1 hypothetical protein SAMN05443667_10815 [Flavobacterium gillisiae]
MPKLKINIFGEGIEIRQVQLDADRYQQWTEIALKKKRLLPDLLLDPFFYYQLKDSSITSILDLNATVISGVLDKPKSQIEIWFNRHKVLKVKPNQLFNEMVLFPLYQIEKNSAFNSNELEPGLYSIKKEIGLIASLELQIATDRIEIDDFTFTTSVFQNEQFLTDIKYQNQNLNVLKNDTLTTYQTGFEIK